MSKEQNSRIFIPDHASLKQELEEILWLIVLEGADGTGKTTLARVLWRRLEKILGTLIPIFSFPSPTAKMMLDRLSKETPPEDRQLVFTRFFITDFMRYLPAIRQHRGICIFDRFVLSTLVYQYFRFPVPDRDERVLQDVEAFLAELEQYTMRMQTFILTGSAEMLKYRIEMRGEGITMFEKDIETVVRGYGDANDFAKKFDLLSQRHIVPIKKDGEELLTEELCQQVVKDSLGFLETSRNREAS